MKRFFIWFRSFCVNSFPFVAFCLVVSNFIVSCSASRAAHPRYFYKTFVVTNYIHSVVTSFVHSADSPSGSSAGSSAGSSSPVLSRPSPPVFRVPYDFIVLSGSPAVRLFGRVYYEGDFTSRGLILRIFPDRIVLHNGSSFENTNYSEERPNLKGIKNDR